MFRFIASSDKPLFVSAVSDSYPAILISVFNGSCGALSCRQVRHSFLALIEGLISGEEIFIAVQGSGAFEIQIHEGPFVEMTTKPQKAPLLTNRQIARFTNFNQRFYTASDLGFFNANLGDKPTFFRYILEESYPDLRLTLSGASNVFVVLYTFDVNQQLVYLTGQSNRYVYYDYDFSTTSLPYLKSSLLMKNSVTLKKGQEILIATFTYRNMTDTIPYNIMIQELVTEYYYQDQPGPKAMPLVIVPTET